MLNTAPSIENCGDPFESITSKLVVIKISKVSTPKSILIYETWLKLVYEKSMRAE